MPRVHRYFKELRLRQLRAIVELARRGSFAAVARSLDLSVASVWQQIRGMEKEFGVSLVQVIGRQVKLTDEGRLLVDRAAPVVEGFDGLRELFREPSESVPRRIVTSYRQCTVHNNRGVAFYFSGRSHRMEHTLIYDQGRDFAIQPGTSVDRERVTWRK